MSQQRPDHEPSDALASTVVSLVGTLAVAAFVYLSALGFAGGTVPLVDWHLPGGALAGLAWLAVLGSVGFVVLWVVPLLAAAALCSTLTRLRPARVQSTLRRTARPRPLKQAA